MRTNYVIVIIFLFLLKNNVGFAQCIASAAKSSTIFSNNSGIGSVAWLTPSNTATSDNVRTIAGSLIGILSSSSANWNVESGFGFSLPAYAIICGIKVDIEKRAQGLLIGSSVTDNSVKILKGGAVTGTEHASAAAWSTTDTYVSYGGPTDAWGTTWTAADINASNFGIAYSANLNAGLAALFLSAEVDHVQITVYYDLILPVKLIDFSAACDNEGVLVKWATASESDNEYFTVERTKDGVTFEEAGKIKGAKNKSERSDYSFVDRHPLNGTAYYRLKQTDGTGFSKEYSLAAVDCKFDNINTPFPNPSTGNFSINAEGELIVYGMNGKIVYSQNISGNTQIDLSDKEKGVYFYRLISSGKVISSGKLFVE